MFMNIYNYIKELERCNIDGTSNCLEKRSYNDTTYAESVESYTMKLNKLFNNFKNDCLTLNNDRIIAIANDVNNLKNTYYDIPDKITINSMKSDFEKHYNQSLKNDIRFAEFLSEMVATQKYFINETIKWLSNLTATNSPKTIIEESSQEPRQNEITTPNVIKGVKGLAEYLNIGKTLAQSIINSKLLMENKAQYRAGRIWLFSKQKLDELLAKKPEILKNARIKRS